MIKTAFNIIVKEADDDKRQMTVIGSKQINDRDNDIVSIDGMDLKNYKKNPVFLWSHRGSETPENIMGTAKKVWTEGKNLMFKLEFLDMDVNPRADMVYKMFKSKALRAFSIGFAPDWEKAAYNEKRGGFDFPKSELLEISAVAVPANPAALANEFKQMVKTGNADEVEIKDFEVYLEENFEEVEEEIPFEKRFMLLENKVNELETKLKVLPQEKEEDPPEPGALHIVDQALGELFESSDDKSSDDSGKGSDEDDPNSIINEVMTDG